MHAIARNILKSPEQMSVLAVSYSNETTCYHDSKNKK